MALFFMMFASRCTTWLTKEGEVRCTGHVSSSKERTRKSDIHEHAVTIMANVVDDLIFRKEPREWEHSAESKSRNNPSAESYWHELAKPTHVFLHFKRVMRRTMAN